MSPFASNPDQSIAAWGEVRLITAIRRWLGNSTPQSPAGIGDDCAVLSGTTRRQLITVDPVIFGQHFDATVPARGVGAKLFNRNLSDIAAMGGRPRAAVVALALSPTVSIDWLKDFYGSLATIARSHRVPIIGGDIATQKEGLNATMTVIGEATSNNALTRNGAQQGDWIFVTGALGGSRLGWHWKFKPRLEEGQWLASRPEVRSLLDLSDGIAKDILALTPKGCRAALNSDTLPVSRSALAASKQSGQSPLHHALTDGEDYELLFTVNGRTSPADFIAAWRERFKLRLTCLGCFEKTRSRAKLPTEINLAAYHGFEHLR